MTQRVSDPWRLRDALSGDTAAWADIIDNFNGTMWHWARSQGLSNDDAEDVCQDVWYLLRDKGHTITDPRALPGWLATTTRRQAISVSKRSARTTASLTEERLANITTSEPSPADIAIADDQNQRLTAAFSRLRDRCQELLSLLWADVAYTDVAEHLDMAIGSIGETRRRCLEQLRVEAGIS